MTQWQMILYICIAVLVTILVRGLPFLVFRNGQAPSFILWTGKRLPAAAMAMLVIYCMKDISFGTVGEWMPTLAACVLTVVLHASFRKMVISICGGTALYMILLHIL
ncbi:MAG: AzlD domain-containing protein [Clostridia bacterium]|nr:AzlD domain-containing protein [Clostridia bacterium]MBR0216333.1 AzlD domain-containing protein [Clostridia bacterium]